MQGIYSNSCDASKLWHDLYGIKRLIDIEIPQCQQSEFSGILIKVNKEYGISIQSSQAQEIKYRNPENLYTYNIWKRYKI